MRDSIRLDVQASQSTSGPLYQCKRGPACATSDIEDMAALTETEKIGNLGLLDRSPPSLLANVLVVHFPPQFSCKIAAEAPVLRTVEIKLAGHPVLVILRSHRPARYVIMLLPDRE